MFSEEINKTLFDLNRIHNEAAWLFSHYDQAIRLLGIVLLMKVQLRITFFYGYVIMVICDDKISI